MTAPRTRLAVWGLVLFGAGIWAFGGLLQAAALGLGFDSHAYWSTSRHTLYDQPPLARDAYLYSPLFAEVIRPLTRLPWPAFGIAWSALEAVAFGWLLWPAGGRRFLPAFLFCLPEIATGNVYAFLAISLVAFSRRPWAIAFPLLTKITPGLVPVLYLVLRGRRRALVVGLGATALVAVVSFTLAADDWVHWVRFLYRHSSRSGPGPALPLWLSLLAHGASLALVVLAARQRRPALLAPAMILSLPVLGLNALTLLAAVPRLQSLGRGDHDPGGSSRTYAPSVPAVRQPRSASAEDRGEDRSSSAASG